MNSIRILNGALDEEGEEIILRGRIDPECLVSLQADDYQREKLPLQTIQRIVEGFGKSEIPDIDLSMRGQRVREEKDGSFLLMDPVFIVDGLQRTTAAIAFATQGGVPRLGATIHFGKDKEWERERFRILNVDRHKLSANILMRNLRSTHEVVRTLHNLSEDDREFALYGKVN